MLSQALGDFTVVDPSIRSINRGGLQQLQGHQLIFGGFSAKDDMSISGFRV